MALGQPHGGASRAASGPPRLAWHHKLLLAMTAVLAPAWLAGAIDRETAPLGAALLIAGVAWHGWCSGFARSDQGVGRRGPHALVRHPRYLGNLLVIAGATFTVPFDGVLQGALPLLALAVCVLRAARVERKLERRRPALVAEPKRILPAVLPSPASLLRALRERRLGGFDWARVRGEGGHLLVLPLLASLLLL